MTCMYKALVDNLICAFMRILYYMMWLKRGFINEDLNSTSLNGGCYELWRFEVVDRCHEILFGGKDLHTRECTLDGSKLFGSTKRKLVCHLVPIATHVDSTK